MKEGTLHTLKPPLVHTHTHTHTRSYPHLDKPSATGVAAVRLLPGVDARVSLQVGWSVELRAAHVAAVRLVTCEGIKAASGVGFEKRKEKNRSGKRYFLYSLT